MYRGDFLFLEKGILSHQQMTQFVVSMFRYVYIELYIYITFVLLNVIFSFVPW